MKLCVLTGLARNSSLIPSMRLPLFVQPCARYTVSSSGLNSALKYQTELEKFNTVDRSLSETLNRKHRNSLHRLWKPYGVDPRLISREPIMSCRQSVYVGTSHCGRGQLAPSNGGSSVKQYPDDSQHISALLKTRLCNVCMKSTVFVRFRALSIDIDFRTF